MISKRQEKRGLMNEPWQFLKKSMRTVNERNLVMDMYLKGPRLTGREIIYAKSAAAQRIQHGSAGITEESNIQKQTLKSINWLFLLLSEIVKYYQKD